MSWQNLMASLPDQVPPMMQARGWSTKIGQPVTLNSGGSRLYTVRMYACTFPPAHVLLRSF